MASPKLIQTNVVVLQGLDQVCSGTKFGRYASQAKLLRFLVKKTLANEELTRKTIAVEFFGYETPDEEACARVGARLSELREKLHYYSLEESDGDAVVFELPARGYNVGWTVKGSAPSSASDQSRGVSPILLPNTARDTLARSGMSNAFRIKIQNDARVRRVTELVREECKRKRPHFRLVASSGNSYLPPSGTVWAGAGLGRVVKDRNCRFEVILESPFSDFAECRALANGTTNHHWFEKVNRSELQKLAAERSGVSVRVTDIPVNCSLFITTNSIFYDPYLWAAPDSVQRTENNFWVFEFGRTPERDYNCYDILVRHFDFVRQHSISLNHFLSAQHSYDRRTEAFERRMKLRLSQARRHNLGI
jgi:hypothetical protein